jgi:hypothetical protein
MKRLGGWRKQHNEEVHYNYHVKEEEMNKACSTYGEKRNAYRICGKAIRKETMRKA